MPWVPASSSLTNQVLFDEVFNELGQQDELLALATDRLQSTRAVLDQEGNIIQTLDYDSFGVINDLRDQYGDTLSDIPILGGTPGLLLSQLATTTAFAGRTWDNDAGLYYNRARWYAPDTGRFISEDPIGFGDGPNVYRYAGNNPVTFVDPSGLAIASPLNGLAGGFGGNVVSTIGNAFTEVGRTTGLGSNAFNIGNSLSTASTLGNFGGSSFSTNRLDTSFDFSGPVAPTINDFKPFSRVTSVSRKSSR